MQLLIYSDTITPRLEYITELFFDTILRTPYRLTINFEDFRLYSGPKIFYSKNKLNSNGFHIKAHNLLFEDNIHKINFEVYNKKNFKIFFIDNETPLGYDPLRARFGINARLEYYNANLLTSIVIRSAKILGAEIEPEAAYEIARRSRGTPRIANNLLRRTRDFAQIKGNGSITVEITRIALEALDVDQDGLDEMDNRILSTIIEKFKGGPVGLGTIATAVGEEPETIEEVYEPFLIQEGYIKRTSRGREATELAYKHLKIKPHGKIGNLFNE